MQPSLGGPLGVVTLWKRITETKEPFKRRVMEDYAGQDNTEAASTGTTRRGPSLRWVLRVACIFKKIVDRPPIGIQGT